MTSSCEPLGNSLEIVVTPEEGCRLATSKYSFDFGRSLFQGTLLLASDGRPAQHAAFCTTKVFGLCVIIRPVALQTTSCRHLAPSAPLALLGQEAWLWSQLPQWEQSLK